MRIGLGFPAERGYPWSQAQIEKKEKGDGLMKKIFCLCLISLAFFLSGSLNCASAQSKGPIRIGFLAPLSGGLAPLLVQEVGDVILKVKEEGMSILIVEQNLLFALRVSTETHLMSKGTIVYSSSPQELWANQEVKYQYLGV
jgi:ABC-type lipopolysaccharide export system ATPase subunit